MKDALGWALIAAGLIAVARTQPWHRGNAPVVVASPSPELEVDPTRWRHGGEQPVSFTDGNQSPMLDEQTTDLLSISG